MIVMCLWRDYFPPAFRGLLLKPIVDVLTYLSKFFKAICSSKLSVKDVETLEGNIVLILCNLEKIFLSAFFDSMEHFMTHLLYEAKVGGPMQYRWMYPSERYMLF